MCSQLLSQLVAELDSLEEVDPWDCRVSILAATNWPEAIDESLLRDGAPSPVFPLLVLGCATICCCCLPCSPRTVPVRGCTLLALRVLIAASLPPCLSLLTKTHPPHAGRFEEVAYVGPPEANARFDIISTCLQDMVMGAGKRSSQELHTLASWLADRTEGYTGADLQHLCRVAYRHAVRTSDRTALVEVQTVDLEYGLSVCPRSVSDELLLRYEQWAPP